MMRLFLRAKKKQQGSVSIIIALSMTVLVGFVGIALDLGKLYVVKSELQNSADACALAAAQALTSTSSQQLVIAEAAGITTGQRHKILFQSRRVTLSVNEHVEFSDSANGSYLTKAGLSNNEILTKRYARCTVSSGEIDNWFIEVLNIIPGVATGKQQVEATAVAGLQPSMTTCAIPVGLCSTNITASTPVGTWIQAGISGGGNFTGNFRWIDFTPPSGGASELAGWLKADGACELPVIGSSVGQTGNISSLSDEWNSRFGIYKGSVRPEDAKPDLSGYAYTDAATSWPSKFNALSDFINKRSANVPYQGDTLAKLKTQGTTKDANHLRANGAERRLMIAPVVDCNGFAGGSSVAPIRSWACVFLLHPINNSAGGGANSAGSGLMYLEYEGNASRPGSPCTTTGMPGGAGVGPLVTTLIK
jgi:Flp pilus assembly protein TadG